MRRIHRPIPTEASSSSDEEDAFAALSEKKRKLPSVLPVHSRDMAAGPIVDANTSSSVRDNTSATTPSTRPIVTTDTSSNKRHHHMSTERAAKLDALLQELKADASSVSTVPNVSSSHVNDGFVPIKKGSFVEAGEELSTTNIFVGNLDPSVTEEMLTDLFRQFGDLYSVKIMWPRTAEERARGRNTGFVCFMNREDAEEAMDALQDTDCFQNGRRMLLRWGKNVKKTVKRGTGGVPIAPIRGTRNARKDAEYQRMDSQISERGSGTSEPVTSLSVTTAAAGSNGGSPGSAETGRPVGRPLYAPDRDAWNAIRIIPPTNLNRVQFISIVASFVARDGSSLERRLLEKEGANPDFAFLLPLDQAPLASREEWRQEQVFYRWRVYAYTQNDGVNVWNTTPFRMFEGGQWWIPPPLLDTRAAQKEEEQVQQKEEEMKSLQEQRRMLALRKDYMTGRQLEHAKLSKLYGVEHHGLKSKRGEDELTEDEMKEFHSLFREKLTGSRRSICEAMAFCFDKSNCAVQICNLLKDVAMESGSGVSIDTRVARLYLLSDVLFNSQQPGVRNAFRYRDIVEEMAPAVFESLGKESTSCGRMTFHKLHNAVTGVLDAWSSWSVYNEKFVQDLKFVFQRVMVVN